jgi:hypothetical protein
MARKRNPTGIPQSGFWAVPGRLDEFREHHTNGLNWTEISEKLGKGTSEISRIAKSLKLPVQTKYRPRGPNQWWGAENRLERLQQLREDGLSCEKIGAILGTTKNAVVGALGRLGMLNDAAPPPSTTLTRCDGLHAAMDAVLAETQDMVERSRLAMRGK